MSYTTIPVTAHIQLPIPRLDCSNGTIDIMSTFDGYTIKTEFSPYINMCKQIINKEIDILIKNGKDIDRKRLTEMLNSNDSEMNELAFNLLSETKYSIRLIKYLKQYKEGKVSEFFEREIICVIREYNFNNMLNLTDEIC